MTAKGIKRTTKGITRRTLLAGVAVAVAVTGCAGSSSAQDDQTSPDDARTVTIQARNFAYEPDELVVEAGDSILVELHSLDGEHDLTSDQLDWQLIAPPGQTTTKRLDVPAQSGTYELYCSIPGHAQAGMTLTLVVQDPSR